MRPYCYRLTFKGLDGNGVTVALILEKPQPALVQPRVGKVFHPVTGVAVNLIIPLNQLGMVGVTHQYHVMLVEQGFGHGPVVGVIVFWVCVWLLRRRLAMEMDSPNPTPRVGCSR